MCIHIHMCIHKHVRSMAGVYMHRGKLPEALKLFHKSLAVKEKLLGRGHPDVAGTKEK